MDPFYESMLVIGLLIVFGVGGLRLLPESARVADGVEWKVSEGRERRSERQGS